MPSQNEVELRNAFKHHKAICLHPIVNGHPHHQRGEIIDIEDREQNQAPLFTVKCADGIERCFAGSQFLSVKPR